MSGLHPLQRRARAEELVRLRRSDERRRYTAPQRAGRVDPNPHQIEAVMFALSRLPEGGCILADEVGLGKTIEAGLVIAQRFAEGARRVLLIAPKPLLGQWRQELFDLFGLPTVEARPEPGGFDGDGVLLAGREMATGPRGQAAIAEAAPFDLVVIDEAHELFSSLHRRFKSLGAYDPEAKEAKLAGRLYEMLQASEVPALLLTATPIQNALTELWSLVQYVDRTSTLLGQLPTFREIFCAGPGDRQVTEGEEEELRRRLQSVLKRTLRRQAQPFLDKPFVERQARTFEYQLSPEERALYDDVTSYLLEPGIAAFRGNQRRLLLIGFHRRMASSRAALAASLDRVVARLRRMLEGEPVRVPEAAAGLDPDARELLHDLEEDPEDVAGAQEEGPEVSGGPSPEAIRAELERVEGLARRAREVRADAKLQALLGAARLVRDRGRAGDGSGKLVIFTESLATQDYLEEALVASGLYRPEQITVFRGNNTGPRASAALRRWREEVQAGAAPGEQPAADIAVRAALVHEFRARTQVFISTEAGAKGLNLQFCETLVNYDLPWNPQRIEQRIGRCHRYGQTHAVTVMNFISADNEAEQLTYAILSQKLELFGTVLDATDEILHAPGGTASEALVSALGPALEGELRRIFEQARTREEIAAELRRLDAEMADRKQAFEATHQRTAGIIESAFDEELQRVFRGHREALAPELAALDRDLEAVATAFLEARGARFRVQTEPARRLIVEPSSDFPHGLEVAVGSDPERPSLHLGHPLIEAALEEARAAPVPAAVRARVGGDPELDALRGRRGRLALVWVRYDGFEQVDAFLPVIVLEGEDEALPEAIARRLLEGPLEDIPARDGGVSDADFDDALEERLFDAGRRVDAAEAERYHARLARLERYMDDRTLILRRRLEELGRRLEHAAAQRDAALETEARRTAERRHREVGEDIEALEANIAGLERRDDPLYARLRSRGLERRYVPPTPARVFDVQLEIA